MARNIIIENDRAWYLRVRYVDPLTGKNRERKEPCAGLGKPTPENVALVLKIAEIASLEGETRRREGRPTKPERCERCDGAMVIHGAPAGALTVGAPIVPGAAPAVAADLPKPSEFVDAHVVFLREGHEAGSVENIKANLQRVIREVGDRWVGGMDGVGAWLATAKQTRLDADGEPLPMKESTRDKIRTFINGLIGWAQTAGEPWSRIPLTPLRKKRETIRQKHDRGGDDDELTEPLSLDTLRALLALTEDRSNWLPEYMRLGVQICALTGLSGVDAHGLMTGSDRIGVDGLSKDSRGRVTYDRVWLNGRRRKSAVPVHQPLLPWVTERLAPFWDGKTGFRVPEVAGIETWTHHWTKIEEALGIPHIDRQGIKRLRVTFNVLLENTLRQPVSVCKTLMGHKIKGRDAHAAYTKPTDDLLVEAMRAFEGLVFPTPG